MGNPRAKFCNCPQEPKLKHGDRLPAYLKDNGHLTLNPFERVNSQIFGYVTWDGLQGPMFTLSAHAEKILSDE